MRKRGKVLEQKRLNELINNLERSILRTRANIRVIKMKQRFYDALKEENEKILGVTDTTPKTFMGRKIEIDDTITGGYSIEQGSGMDWNDI